MARTKKSKRKTTSTTKVPTLAENKQIPVDIHRPMDSGSDIEDIEADDTPANQLSTPTVSLEDISTVEGTPKLTRPTTKKSLHMGQTEDSDDSHLVDTPTSTQKSLDTTPGSQETSSNKRRKRCEPYTFTDEQESDLSEWYQFHPLFYDKTEKHYKNSFKKNCLLEEKGMTMSPRCSCK